MVDCLRWFLFAALVSGAGCGGAIGQADECDEGMPCGQGELCVDGTCRRLCNRASDCGDGETCCEGLCCACDPATDDSCLDCAGAPGGNARLDHCGVCDEDPNNDCVQDCAGTWGGSAVEDNCGVCDDNPDNDCVQDCTGTWGGSAVEDNCGVCDDNPDNDCVQDCAGTWGGSAVEDNCGVCDDNPDNDCVQDCTGTWGGSDNRCFRDVQNGLAWQTTPPSQMYYANAVAYCDNLSLAGFTDWRLPSIAQLRQLTRGCPDNGGNTVGESCTTPEGALGMPCVGCAYLNGPADGCYWPDEAGGSCRPLADGTQRAWWSRTEESHSSYRYVVYYGDAAINILDNINFACSVRCVRVLP